MFHMNKSICFVAFLLILSHSVNGQANSYIDPAQAYLRLLLEKDANSTVRIGSFKVIGSPYLFGEKHTSNFYAKEVHLNNVQISYNTYSQDIELFINGQATSLIKDAVSVDSFYILPDNKTESFTKPLFFVSNSIVFAKDKAFFQQLYSGTKYSLYKKYKSDLGYVSTNYVQSDLRQFDLIYEYYYVDVLKKEIKKIKVTESFLKKEFKSVKDLSTILQDGELNSNPEITLINLFTFLNI